MVSNEELISFARFSQSFYLYDEETIKSQIQRLKSAFPSIEFLYSIKCNPHKGILETVFANGLGADAASAKEVELAAQNGLAKGQIFYSAPGKTIDDIEDSLETSTIIADSLTEVSTISELAGKSQAQIGLRINPNFSFDEAGGAPSKFGVDEDEALAYMQDGVPSNIKITGIHVHIKSQELDAEKLARYYANMLDLAQRAQAALGHQLDYINMGSGIGVAYSKSDSEVDIEALGESTREMFAEFREAHPTTRLLIETGRYVVCQSGIYVTHVVDRKASHGKTFIILQGTLNCFARPALARLFAQCNASAAEPLFTSPSAFSFDAPYPERSTEVVTLAGNLCTSADIIAEDIEMPHLEPGDIVIINNAGAYARTLSPAEFSSQDVPGEYLWSDSLDI